MIVPQHIWAYIQRMEDELQRRYEKTKKAEIKKALKDLKSDKDFLKFHQNSSETHSGENLTQTSFFINVYPKGCISNLISFSISLS